MPTEREGSELPHAQAASSSIASSSNEPGKRAGLLELLAQPVRLSPLSRRAAFSGNSKGPLTSPSSASVTVSGEMDDLRRRQQAIRARDVARRRVRSATLAAAALATAATGVIASVTASSSTTPRKVGRQLLAAATTTKTVAAVPEPTATVPAEGFSAPSSAPSAPSSAPSSVSAGSTPAVVSGGS